MKNQRDTNILRDLAKRYAEIAGKAVQEERRELWRRHNSFEKTRPLVYAREFLSIPELIEPELQCHDFLFRQQEKTLRYWIQHDSFEDDYVIEPWLALNATHRLGRFERWGLPVKRIASPQARGAWKYDPPIKSLEDASGLHRPHHLVDREATARNFVRLQDAVGDIVPIVVSRAPVYSNNLAEQLADLRGLEQVMWDMTDNPAWLHELVAFLRDGVLATYEEAQTAQDWQLIDGTSQSLTYSMELPDPKADGRAVDPDQLWCFFNAQEFTLVSPAMHDDFILQYQIPLMAKFGLVAYGCCEDLTSKIDMLRKIPNLRRIAVTPFADVPKCAEQIGEDYIISWRPSPAEMVANTFDPERIRKVVGQAVDAMQGCHFDICLKDVITVRGEAWRIKEWVRITREVVEQHAS